MGANMSPAVLSLVLCITLLAAAPLRAAALTPEQLLEATLGSAISQPTRAEVARSPANRRAAVLLASPISCGTE
jgi:hypothetical protein